MNNSSKHLEQNVHGWERAMSLAGGLYFLAKGLRRGGLGGLLQLGIGGMAVARGVTGHCEAQRVFNEVSEQAGIAGGGPPPIPLGRYESKKGQMQANAPAATNGTTVTGNDDLKSPPAGV